MVSPQTQDWITDLLKPPPPLPVTNAEGLRTACFGGFRCLLDDQPAAKARKKEWGRLIVNPHCFLSRDRSIRMPFLDTSSATVWVSDPATGAILPFSLGPRFRHLVSSLNPGNPEPAGLGWQDRFVLKMAGVLVEPNYAERRRRNYERVVKRSGTLFRECGYVPLQGLIHPFHLAALRSYYRELIRSGNLEVGDPQCRGRYGAHNETIARFFHHQLTAVVSDIAGEPTMPSYVYFASYQPGARLSKHTDREQCEFSISLCVDFAPEPIGRTRWPLCLETRKGPVKIFQRLGEGLLYRGRELPHYRPRLPQNCTSTSLFFHYVRRDFTGPLN